MTRLPEKPDRTCESAVGPSGRQSGRMTTLLVDAHNLTYRAWFNRERREDLEAAAGLFVAALRYDGLCAALASRPGLPEHSMLELLEKTDCEAVLNGLARFLALPDHLQLFLSCDGRPGVRRAMKSNPGLTREARARLSAFPRPE